MSKMTNFRCDTMQIWSEIISRVLRRLLPAISPFASHTALSYGRITPAHCRCLRVHVLFSLLLSCRFATHLFYTCAPLPPSNGIVPSPLLSSLASFLSSSRSSTRSLDANNRSISRYVDFEFYFDVVVRKRGELEKKSHFTSASLPIQSALSTVA